MKTKDASSSNSRRPYDLSKQWKGPHIRLIPTVEPQGYLGKFGAHVVGKKLLPLSIQKENWGDECKLVYKEFKYLIAEIDRDVNDFKGFEYRRNFDETITFNRKGIEISRHYPDKSNFAFAD